MFINTQYLRRLDDGQVRRADITVTARPATTGEAGALAVSSHAVHLPSADHIRAQTSSPAVAGAAHGGGGLPRRHQDRVPHRRERRGVREI